MRTHGIDMGYRDTADPIHLQRVTLLSNLSALVYARFCREGGGRGRYFPRNLDEFH
jgi:hypothetical protein